MTLLIEGVLIVGLMLCIGVGGLFVVHRFLPHLHRHEIREGSEAVWAVAGGVFGLLLGFMVVVLWENLTDAQTVVQNETNHLGSLFRLAGGFPDPERRQLRGEMREYAQLMVDE